MYKDRCLPTRLRAEELTCMYLTLHIDLFPVWVSASCDVDGGHVEAVVTLPDALHVADQIRVFFCLVFVPHHCGIIVMLCREMYGEWIPLINFSNSHAMNTIHTSSQ